MSDQKPPPVEDIYEYMRLLPPEPSARLLWWIGEIFKGWRPDEINRPMATEASADWYGVYIIEYRAVLFPMLKYLEALFQE